MRLILSVLFMALVLSGHGQQRRRPSGSKHFGGLAASVASGKIVYQKHCLTCHQIDGTGVPYLNPSLSGSSWVKGPKPRLIKVVLKGLSGQEIDGETYGNVMPGHAFLTDKQVADLLTYVRRSFGNRASPVTAAEVKTVRRKK